MRIVSVSVAERQGTAETQPAQPTWRLHACAPGKRVQFLGACGLKHAAENVTHEVARAVGDCAAPAAGTKRVAQLLRQHRRAREQRRERVRCARVAHNRTQRVGRIFAGRRGAVAKRIIAARVGRGRLHTDARNKGYQHVWCARERRRRLSGQGMQYERSASGCCRRRFQHQTARERGRCARRAHLVRRRLIAVDVEQRPHPFQQADGQPRKARSPRPAGLEELLCIYTLLQKARQRWNEALGRVLRRPLLLGLWPKCKAQIQAVLFGHAPLRGRMEGCPEDAHAVAAHTISHQARAACRCKRGLEARSR